MNALQRNLKRLGACPESIKWAAQHETLESAWAACNLPDWLLWYAGKMAGGPDSPGRRRIVGVAAACARTVWAHMPAGGAARKAIEIAESYARGEISGAAASAAASAASDAASDAAWAAASAAWAAASAAASAASDAASDAAWAAAWAAASAASAAASAAAWAAAWAAWNRKMLDIVRAAYPAPPEREV